MVGTSEVRRRNYRRERQPSTSCSNGKRLGDKAETSVEGFMNNFSLLLDFSHIAVHILEFVRREKKTGIGPKSQLLIESAVSIDKIFFFFTIKNI